MATATPLSLPGFRNEAYADFSKPENRKAMEQALANARSRTAAEYELLIAGERVKTGDTLRSLNPSRPDEVVGVHHKATPELARRAVESAFAFFPEWSRHAG
jgi:Delta 1-pyrroline-5-carboxylate dehydrogenase